MSQPNAMPAITVWTGQSHPRPRTPHKVESAPPVLTVLKAHQHTSCATLVLTAPTKACIHRTRTVPLDSTVGSVRNHHVRTTTRPETHVLREDFVLLVVTTSRFARPELSRTQQIILSSLIVWIVQKVATAWDTVTLTQQICVTLVSTVPKDNKCRSHLIPVVPRVISVREAR